VCLQAAARAVETGKDQAFAAAQAFAIDSTWDGHASALHNADALDGAHCPAPSGKCGLHQAAAQMSRLNDVVDALAQAAASGATIGATTLALTNTLASPLHIRLHHILANPVAPPGSATPRYLTQASRVLCVVIPQSLCQHQADGLSGLHALPCMPCYCYYY
jgi:hypothetical protein